MSKANDVKRALKSQKKWSDDGSKKVPKYNKTNGTNFIHDVAVLGPYISSAPQSVLEFLLTKEGIEFLRIDVSSIPQRDSATTFSSLYTYVLTLVERKFGPDSVRKDISKDPHGFRGFKNDPQVIEFAQGLIKITLERIALR